MINILSLTLILAVLLGVVPSLLPGAAADEWVIKQDYGCVVYMPHGKRVCSAVTLDGATVRSEAY